MKNVVRPVQKTVNPSRNRIVEFLRKMNFKDVNGGQNFQMGGIQVDACGGYEDTLLVVNYLTLNKKSGNAVRKEIQTFKENIPIISKAFHKDLNYSIYSKIKYIFVAKNTIFNEEDNKFIKEKPQINIWDEQFLDYYTNLINTIGIHARYNLLGEIGVEPRVEDIINVPAFQTRMKNYTVYIFFIEPNKLIQASYVARREEGKEKYYQRLLNKKRIGEIRKFIQKPNGLFPNNIIVSFNKSPIFHEFKEVSSRSAGWPDWLRFGLLTFPLNYRSCWIIDGQHRLYAFSAASKEDKIVVAAFDNLPQEKQAQFFININREQKPVEADLIWDLEGEMSPNTPDGIISNIVKQINESYPLKDKIYIPLRGKKKRGQLKFSGLCLSIRNRKLTGEFTEKMEGGQKNPLFSTNSQRIIENTSSALVMFFSKIDEQLDDIQKNEFIYTNGGISIAVAIFERILSRINKIPNSDELKKYIDALHVILSNKYPDKSDWKRVRLSVTSEGGKTELIDSLCLAIRETIGDRQFGGRIDIPDFESRVSQFERRLAKFIFNILRINTLDELKPFTSNEIYGQTKQRELKDLDNGIKREATEHLTLGECLSILKYANNWNLFKKHFLETETGFGSETEFQAATQAVNNLRIDKFHGKTLINKYKERDLIYIYLDKLEKCIEE